MSRADEFHRLSAVETDDCVLWPYNAAGKGYGVVTINSRKQYCHVAALERRVQRQAPDALALHSCRNKRCMNYRHLRWGTRCDNAADAIADGAIARGSRNGAAKLWEGAVDRIRVECQQGLTQGEVAERFGVLRQTVNYIVRERTWTRRYDTTLKIRIEPVGVPDEADR